ncbi:hypothetical protein [Candidatus Hodgkinia cicadicola]|uniref:hypothetical protein n=1 Tax=Candidatus Hodgkinia cicadicola TaxID=573658 RepID=UPI001788AA34
MVDFGRLNYKRNHYLKSLHWRLKQVVNCDSRTHGSSGFFVMDLMATKHAMNTTKLML